MWILPLQIVLFVRFCIEVKASRCRWFDWICFRCRSARSGRHSLFLVAGLASRACFLDWSFRCRALLGFQDQTVHIVTESLVTERHLSFLVQRFPYRFDRPSVIKGLNNLGFQREKSPRFCAPTVAFLLRIRSAIRSDRFLAIVFSRSSGVLLPLFSIILPFLSVTHRCFTVLCARLRAENVVYTEKTIRERR